MLVIPFSLTENEYSLFIGLQDDNIDRIRAYDPAQVVTANLGERWAAMRLKAVIVGYATAEDLARVAEMINKGTDPFEALRFLTRGFAFRPDAGDYDGPYLSAKRGKERAQ